MHRFVLSFRGRERYFELAPGDEALIGRSLDARFFLNHPSVSRRHCTLRGAQSGVDVEDHGSKNATLVNGWRIDARARLTDGCVLQVGSLELAVRFVRD